MKKSLILLAILIAASASGYSQSIPPTRWTEADGSPSISPPKTVIVPNGSISGRTVTLTGGGGGSGTVTSVSVVSANGFAGSVATATTTPAITLSTTITGILSGNGTAISAATTTGSGSVVLATAPTIAGSTITLSPTVTTGSGATAGIIGTANSLTTGNGFEFSSSSVTSGSVLSIASTSTAGATGMEALNIAVSGANGSTAQTITGGRISVTNTNGTSGTNVALELTASGATTANTALNVTAGIITTGVGSAGVPSITGSTTTTGLRFAGNLVVFDASGVDTGTIDSTGFTLRALASLGYNIGSSGVSSADVFLTRAGAANWRLGVADAAAPVAQTLSVQNVIGGTTDTAGAAWTFTGSRSTGTGAGGSLIFQTSPAAGSTASTQNALVTAFTINSAGHLIAAGTAPTITSGFGTSPSIAGADHAGRVTVGTGGIASTGVVTFGKAFATAPACTVNNETTILLAQITATTTTLTISSATPFAASDKLTYVCIGY